jgi:NADP-dependent 3-hydroxy acid dehydrogenase YdfG
MSELELKETVALVTGASAGIGAAAARALAAKGVAVALVARRENRLNALVEELTAAGGRALAVRADVAYAEQAREAVEQAVARWGRLDILVNNAGLNRPGAPLETPLADWEEMVRVNLLGAMYCAHAAAPHLIHAAEDSPRGVADLINVSSLSGRIVRKDSGVYTTTKHALNAFSESLRMELAGRGVRVSLLEPASVATELFASGKLPADAQTRSYPQLSPEDVADVLTFMVTRPAHSSISELLFRPSRQDRV